MTQFIPKEVYIVGSGLFLPGEAVGNDTIEKHLGLILDKPSRAKRRILNSNQSKTRHYAIDSEHRVLFSNAEMAKEALIKALDDSPLELNEIELLTTGTHGGSPGPGARQYGSWGAGRTGDGDQQLSWDLCELDDGTQKCFLASSYRR